jgi:hypothetical protein
MDRTPLNTRDVAGVIHSVEQQPTNEYRGRPHCGISFSWPIHGALLGTRWTGAHEPITCLTCLVAT